ncbi:MAG: YraN family protein [Bacillota bacterium]|nr:YraN family protein [Bacillota bacterium]MDP4161019.1 YraN family protein [Bacillota bacterium]
MEDKRQSLGKAGEEFAARLLTESGFKIITRNYRCPKGEMDIIARDGDMLVFIEVRTRRSSYRGWGEETITQQKARRLQAIASYYILQQRYASWPSLRFDVLAIRWTKENPDTIWVKGAF